MARRLSGVVSVIAAAWMGAACSLIVNEDEPDCSYSSVAAGGGFTCALGGAGDELSCWGDNTEGALGIGNFRPVTEPTKVDDGISKIAAGRSHACALTRAGTLKCWGKNGRGEVGNDETKPVPEPTDIPFAEEVVDVFAGRDNTCAVDAKARLFCWGDSNQGQNGAGMQSGDQRTPQQVPGIAEVSKVAIGDQSSCAITNSGSVFCWGDNQQHQLADRDASVDAFSPQRVDLAVDGVDMQAKEIDVSDHVCVVTTDEQVACWGSNRFLQLARGAAVGDSETPDIVPGTDGATAVAVGKEHSCALVSGQVLCWGGNRHGQLGRNVLQVSQSDVPEPVPDLTGVLSISAGDFHTCAIDAERRVKCWGSNSAGQSVAGEGVFVAEPILSRFSQDDQGLEGLGEFGLGAVNSCAIDGSGRTWCWGQGSSGQLKELLGGPSSAPVEIVGATRDVDVGDAHVCALGTDARVRCWGAGNQGQLGDGGATFSASPVVVQLGDESLLEDGVIQVATGSEFSCVLRSSAGAPQSGASCWGRNSSGQLGTTSASPELLRAGDVSQGMLGAVFDLLAPADSHICGLSNEQAYCWGNTNNFRVGIDQAEDVTAPTLVPGVPTCLRHIATSTLGSCAVDGTGAVWCWGDNEFGQLGSSAGSFSPELIGLVTNAEQIAMAGSATCVLTVDGQVQCWGNGIAGELGNGGFDNSAAAVTVLAPGGGGPLTGVTAIEAGLDHFCANAGGKLVCWGSDVSGKLGSGRPMSITEPSAPAGLSCSN